VLVALEAHKVVRRRLQMALVLFLVLLQQRAVAAQELLLGKLVVLVAVVMHLAVVAQVAQELLDKVILAVRGMLAVQYMAAAEVVALVLWE